MAIATQAANLFELHCHETQITYSTSSFAGPPQFSYSGADGDLSFSGDDIDTQATKLGTEVTVTLDAVPDLKTITLTLLLPSFRLGADLAAEFETLAVRTTTRTSIAGPPTGPGQSYEAIGLHGMAKSVAF